ncbi:MAG: hypothetical protein K940chlam3_00952 [Chlamydiae bacterium]|nr:hypothetical protein [Chlamydiota bacterium]
MFYQDYLWKNGVPVGTTKLKAPSEEGPCFKIINDPYHKHYSLELYQNRVYDCTIYDSLILDFRKLNLTEQTAWRKEVIEQTDKKLVILIRDMDDRVIYMEHHQFEGTFCRACNVYSSHNWLTSVHKLFYQALDDEFNGLVLYDPYEKPIMVKQYAVNTQQEFTDLKLEEWDMSQWQKLNSKMKISL